MSGKETTTTEYVGKDQAALYLQCNREPEIGLKGTNRRQGPTVVNKYMKEMLAGRWKLNPHGLVFDTEGYLIDGAHRLKALVLAGHENPNIAIAFRVTRNADPDVQLVMDQGQKRQPGDFLVMNGYKNNKVMAAAIKLIIIYDTDSNLNIFSTWRNVAVSPEELVEFAEKNDDIQEACRLGCHAGNVMKASAVSAGVFLTRRDRPDLDSFTFYEQVASGVRLEAHDPAYALREHIAKQRVMRRKYETHEELALYLKSYNLWAQDLPAKASLGYSRVDNFPRIIPAVKVDRRRK